MSEGGERENTTVAKRRSSIQSDSFVVLELEDIAPAVVPKTAITTGPRQSHDDDDDVIEHIEIGEEQLETRGQGNEEEDGSSGLTSILRQSNGGEEDIIMDDTKVKRKGKERKERSATRSKKLVPVWYLFRFAKCLDVIMILIGTLMAIAAGCALPGHILMFGDVIDLFISHDLGSELSSTLRNLMAGDNENFTINPAQVGTLLSGNVTYFCNFSQDESSSNILRFFLSEDPNNLLEGDVTYYSYYYLAMATGMWVASFFSVLFWNMSAYRQTRRMRLAFFRSILSQSIGWFDVNPSNELSTRLADDIEKIQAGIGDKAAVFIQYFTTFIAGFVIAFIRNWKLALVVGSMLPVLSFLAGSIAFIIAKFTVREQNAYASAGAVAEEVLSSIKTVFAFGGENKEIDRYQSKLKKATYEGFKKSLASSIVNGVLISVSFFAFAIGFWYGSILISDCELRAGQVVTVFFGVIVGSYSLGNSLPELQTFAAAMGSATGIYAVIDNQSDIDPTQPTGEKPSTLEGNIELKDVVFKYPARPEVPVLNGISLSVKRGQTVALVGPSGCGKSTVVQLLQRFYNPIAGEITIDGHRIESLNLKWLRSNIGVVSQEPVLFDATISENICHGKEGATMEEIEAAARAANAHNFISELPDKYNTLVGERGTQLSGGQKQRIAIARALVRDPKILLLDEATSALDTESEKIVQDALDKAREGRTTIVIAHRLSTIQQADVIVGIEGGSVVELGTHKELMRNHGLYYDLVTAQTINEEDEKSTDSLSGFKMALRRSASRHSYTRQRSDSQSTDPTSSILRQSSVQSESAYTAALNDTLSRFSLEDIPVVAHPSPALYHRSISREDTSVESSITSAAVVTAGKGISKVTVNEKTVRFKVEEDRIELKRGDPSDEDLDKVPSKELLKLNLPDWYLVIPGIVFSALLGATFPLMAILFSTLLEIFSTPDRDDLLRRSSEYATYFVLLAIAAGINQFMSVATLSIAGERVTSRLRIMTFKAILRQEIGWFDRSDNSTGALASRLATDASEVKGVTGIRFGVLLQLIFGFLTALVIGFTASWLLSIVLFVCFPIIIFVGYLQTRVIRGRSARNKELMLECGKTSTEVIDNIRTVVSLGVEDTFYNHYKSLLREPFRTNMRNVIGSAVIFGITQGLIFAIYAAGFRFGVFLVVSDPSKVYHASYEDIFRVFAAVVFTALTMGRSSSFGTDVQKAQIAANKVFALVKRKPEIDNYSTEGVEINQTTGQVEVKNVFFNYPTRPDVPVLQGLSVSVDPGQTLALVGPSGCGKSTVVSLIERFYDPIGGSLLLEDKDLRDLNIRWLRNQIGIVSQEPVLFDKSIADNIRYGANFREVSDEEVIEAAKAANIHNFIQTLPEGYGTNVGSKGTQLSGGQKQRIAIARALVRDPKILLLDEATSALDTESEKIVQDALDKAREGRTCIVIAHRLSTIYNSDRIAVIHRGQVIEVGNHTSLMAQKGAYYLMNTVKDEEEREGRPLEEVASL